MSDDLEKRIVTIGDLIQRKSDSMAGWQDGNAIMAQERSIDRLREQRRELQERLAMTKELEGAPETIWAEPGMPGYLDEPHELYTIQYTRKDIADKCIAELEAELASIKRNKETIAREFHSQTLKTDTTT